MAHLHTIAEAVLAASEVMAERVTRILDISNGTYDGGALSRLPTTMDPAFAEGVALWLAGIAARLQADCAVLDAPPAPEPVPASPPPTDPTFERDPSTFVSRRERNAAYTIALSVLAAAAAVMEPVEE